MTDDDDFLDLPKPVKVGRSTGYSFTYAAQAYKLCLLGLVDSELAKYFGVTEQTFNNWKVAYPEFFESIQEGRENADANVSVSLYKRAMGYSHHEDKIFNHEGEAMTVPTVKHYPPDTKAIHMWLLNRQRKRWTDTSKIELTGANGGPLQNINADVGNMTDVEKATRLFHLLRQGAGKAEEDSDDVNTDLPD